MSVQESGNRPTRVAGIADLHVGAQKYFPKPNELKDAFFEISPLVDAIAVCGDFTDNGLLREADEAAEFLSGLQAPIVGVLGNHDGREGNQAKIKDILLKAGVIILDGQTYSLQLPHNKITFIGTEGSWQFINTKKRVDEKVIFEDDNEVRKLKQQLRLLRPGTNIVLLHFPPVKKTALSDRWMNEFKDKETLYEREIDRFRENITAVFHGHSHEGNPKSTTRNGVVIYNVSIPVIQGMNGSPEVASKYFRVKKIAA